MHKVSFKYHLLSFLIGVSFSISGQNRQGNIVEYFGKEKVEEVNEGKVVHVFKDGLLLKMRSFGFNSSSTPKNPVFAKFLLENTDEIKAEQLFVNDASGTPSA